MIPERPLRATPRRLFAFTIIALVLFGATLDIIPSSNTVELVLHDTPGHFIERIRPVDRTAWYGPTEHEVGLVRDSIEAAVRKGIGHAGGFPVYQGRKYFSAIGIYNVIWGLLAPRDVERLGAYFELMERLIAFAAALIMAFMIVWSDARLGRAAAALLFLVSATSIYHLQFARSIYWHWFTALAPMIFAWTTYARFRDRAAFRHFAAAIGALTFVRCLFGYEYLSNVIASACIPVAFFEWGERRNFARIVGRMAAVAGAGIGGFLAAAIIHLKMLAVDAGSWKSGWSTFLLRATNRTVGIAGAPSAWPAGTSRRHILRDALDTKMMVLHPLTRTPIVITTMHIAAAGFGIAALYLLLAAARVVRRDAITERLLLAMLLAVPASLSWAILAEAHLWPHAHLTPIIFTLPFIPVCALFVGRAVSAILESAFETLERRSDPEEETAPANAP